MSVFFSTRGSSNSEPYFQIGSSADTLKIVPQLRGIVGTYNGSISRRISTPASLKLDFAFSPKLRLKADWSRIVRDAKRLRANSPDPVNDLINFFELLPGDYATWREIVEEPYG